MLSVRELSSSTPDAFAIQEDDRLHPKEPRSLSNLHFLATTPFAIREDDDVPLAPHQPVAKQIKDAVGKKILVVLPLSWLLSMVLYCAVLTDVEFKDPKGELVPTWKPILVMNLIIAFVVLVVSGAQPEACMLGLSGIAVVFQCVPAKKLFAGASGGAVTSLTLLFPITKALNDTGWPDVVIGSFLGSPKSVMSAVARVFFVVCILSGIIANTPIVAATIPVLQTWCQRLDLDKRAIFMPLTFAAQAGGSLTLIGSTINLVAKEVFMKEFKLKFFDLTLGGAILSLVVGLYCTLVGPTMLSSPEDRQNEATLVACQSLHSSKLYKVEVVVLPKGPFVGKILAGTGLHRIPGLQSLKLASGSEDEPLSDNDTIQVHGTGDGIAAIRRIRGLELANEQSELSMLGAHRRGRRLMEAMVSKELAGKTLRVSEMKNKLKCAVVSVRSSTATLTWQRSQDGYAMEEGDILLLEAHKDVVGSMEWAANFGVVRVLKNSRPQRTGRGPDVWRAVATGLGFVIMIAITIQGKEHLSLQVLALLLLCFLLLIKAVDIKEAYKSVNAGVLLIVIGALALGDAVHNTGLAHYLALNIVKITRPFGPYGVLLGLYVATAGLSVFVTNAAVVAILGEIGINAAEELGLPIQTVALIILYAASGCWMSPYGYQTNVMVMGVGNYTWGDFLKFGAPLQVLHMLACVAITQFCATLM